MRVLVLSGGGSHGAWQAGAVRALAESYSYDAVVGTSVGAINAAGYCSIGSEGTYHLWKKIKKTSDIMRFNFTWPWKFTGLFHFKPLIDLISQSLFIRPIQKDCYAVVMSLETKNVEYIKLDQDLDKNLESLAGSCALSGINTPYNGKIDGGHREASAVKFALDELKATEVHLVKTSPLVKQESKWEKSKYFPLISILLRTLEAMIDEIDKNDTEFYLNRVRVFCPKKELWFDSIKYNHEDLIKALDLGYNEIKMELIK
jgi:predicted acylesterase/phospholipase RssA